MSTFTFKLDPDREITDLSFLTLMSERAFLEWIVFGTSIPETILFQGRVVCHWAEEWAHGRGITVERVLSPRATWRRWHPQWTDQEITALQEKSRRQLAPSRQDELIATLFPEGPFFTPPSLEHAAEWLLWLEGQGIASGSSLRPVLQQATEPWRSTSDDNDLIRKVAYAADSSEAATRFLQDWLLEGRFGSPFPLSVPEHWKQKAREQWQFQPVELGIDAYWERFAKGTFAGELKQLAAEIAHAYLSQHPEQLSAEILSALRPFLSRPLWQELNQKLPPPIPTRVSSGMSADEVLTWFRKKYLPFRTWQLYSSSGDPTDTVASVAESFADWMLDFYPQALGGGAGYNHLAIAASARLQQTTGVTLWIILDGLPVSDGDALFTHLCSEKRLREAENRLCFTCLPTITCFCKPALMNGAPPETQELTETPQPKFSQAVVLKDRTMREQVTAATAGQVLVWSHKAPDVIYHQNQSRETTLSEVESKLKLIADQVVELALGIPDHLAVTVVVSTDHGRLLSADVPRAYALPPQTHSEGRAAWGEGGEHENTDQTVTLTADRFRLPSGVTAHVARGASAFVMSNGASGSVAFPHGGLWPEEVIVPWFSFVRDAQLPSIKITVSGKGRSGGNGTITVSITSAELVNIILHELIVRTEAGLEVWRSRSSRICAPQQETVLEEDLTPYPNVSDLGNLHSEVIVSLPSGVHFTMTALVSLETDTLYSRGLDAQDLLDL